MAYLNYLLQLFLTANGNVFGENGCSVGISLCFAGSRLY